MIEFKAHAKINLMLGVSGKRGDGYHLLDTVMQEISLFDRVLIDIRDGEGTEVSSTGGLPQGAGNIAFKAAQAFKRASGLEFFCGVSIEKGIPFGAGLGGGSSDAAAVIKALNSRFGAPLSRDALLELAASIGADVPFFIVGGCAGAKGIGERLTQLNGMPPCAILLIKPDFGINTGRAFAVFDGLPRTAPPATSEKMADALLKGSLKAVCESLHNDLERAAFEMHPELVGIKRALKGAGAAGAVMSGSGSCIYGVFETEREADAAAAALAGYGRVYIAKPV